MKHYSSLIRIALLAPIFVAFSAAAQTEAGTRHERDVVARTPNLIMKMDRFGTELAIVSDVITERHSCKPDYPLASLRNDETGVVKLKLFVNADGLVSRAKVTGTRGFRDLDRASMLGFLGCRPKNWLPGEISPGAWLDVQYVWTIENPPKAVGH